MNYILTIDNLSCGYGKKIILEDVSLQFEEGKVYSIIGPNGSGKTTLFKTLLKESTLYSGKITVNQRDLNDLQLNTLSTMISFMPQKCIIPEGFTVYEIIKMAACCNKNVTDKLINEALYLCGLHTLKNKPTSELSGGEQQLVLLARTICSKNKIIILDEPINNLDLKNQAVIMSIITKLAKEGHTIIFSNHDLNDTLRYADNVIVINKGKVFATGNPKIVISNSMLKAVFNVEGVFYSTTDESKIFQIKSYIE